MSYTMSIMHNQYKLSYQTKQTKVLISDHGAIMTAT